MFIRSTTLSKTSALLSSSVLLLLISFSQVLQAEPATLDDNLKAMEATNNEAENSQKRISSLQAQTQSLVAEYKRLSQGADYQEEYNAEVRERIAQQDKEIISLREQLTGRDITEQRIIPLMRSMADTLEQFVALDLPFHQEERIGRAIKTKQQVASSSYSLPDKYRALLSAYQQELEYGRSIEAWRGEVSLGEEKLTVEFLRIGRTGFYFQTMDGERSAHWNREKKQWLEIPSKYNADIKQGLRIARNHQAPQMLALPFQNVAFQAVAKQ